MYICGFLITLCSIILLLIIYKTGFASKSLVWVWGVTPDHSENVSKQYLFFSKFSSLSKAKINKSFANYKWVIGIKSLASLNPLIPLLQASLSINRAKTSAARRKRKGERGSPCLTPFRDLKKPYGLPLIRMEKEVVETHCITHWIQELGNPKHCKTFSKNPKSNLS